MNKIKSGDQVYIIAGKDKGKSGKVLSVVAAGKKYIVEGINIAKKHMKGNPNAGEQGGILNKEMPIDRSNVMLLDPNKSKPSKVGIKKLSDGERVRFYKLSGELVDVKG